MGHQEYWAECISEAALDCGLTLSEEQLNCIAKSVMISHDNYGLAFYSPPASDRIHAIECEYEQKLKKKQEEHERYVENAETAVKTALRIRSDSNVSIGEYGEVTRYGGRIERIQ